MRDDVGGAAGVPRALGEADDGVLAPEPTLLSGALTGYGRISTAGQNLDRQIRALRARRLHTSLRRHPVRQDHPTGPSEACRDYLRAGDTLIVPASTGPRSLSDLITPVAELRRAGPVLPNMTPGAK